MEYIEVFKREQKEILKRVQQWFPDAFIYKNTIQVYSRNYDGNVSIVALDNTYIQNNFIIPYADVPFSREDVFEEIGDKLTELKIKDLYPTNISEFIDYMADKYPKHFIKHNNKLITRRSNNIVINYDGDINFETWHNNKLTDVYNFCPFKSVYNNIAIETHYYKFFEKLVVSYLDHIDAFELPKVYFQCDNITDLK